MGSTKLALSVGQAAEALGVSRGTIYRLINSGALHSKRLGRRRLVPLAELERLLQTEEVPGRRRATRSRG
jgi:excisionase family DNA binding protein